MAKRPGPAPASPVPGRLTAPDPRRLRLLGTAPAKVAAGVVALVAVLLLASGHGQTLSVLNFGLIAALAAIGLNLTMGTTGIMSLGHAVFVGFGAFTYAALSDVGVPFVVGLAAAMVVASTASLAIGPLALRLSGLYLAVGTIGIAYIGQHLFVNLRSITGGGAGRRVESPVLFGSRLSDASAVAGRLVTSEMKWFALLLLITTAVGVAVAAFGRLRWGRAFRAVRDDELAAASVGIAVTRTRVVSFTMSAALGGLSGGLLAGYLRYLNPETFDLEASIQYLAMIIIGGLGSVSGAVIGAVLITTLPTLLTFVSSELGLVEQVSGTSGSFNTGTLALIAYGVVIVLVMTTTPRGIAGGITAVGARVTRRAPRTGS